MAEGGSLLADFAGKGFRIGFMSCSQNKLVVSIAQAVSGSCVTMGGKEVLHFKEEVYNLRVCERGGAVTYIKCVSITGTAALRAWTLLSRVPCVKSATGKEKTRL